MEEPGIWDNPEKAQEKMKTLGALKEDISNYSRLVSEKEDLETLIEMANEEPAASYIPEAQEMMSTFGSTLKAPASARFFPVNMTAAMPS